MSFKGVVFRFLQVLFAKGRVSLAAGPLANDVRDVVRLLQPVASPHPLIRIGGAGDGGYLVPDDLEGIVACFSPGVAESAQFELALASKGIRSFLADYSVEKAPLQNDLFDFEKLFLGTITDGDKFIRLDDWIAMKHPGEGDLILQMDIEGAEWSILADLSPDVLRRFRAIVIEIHNLDTMFTNPDGLKIAQSIFLKLNSIFYPVHLHANNCCGALDYMGVKIPRVIEVTFLRRDRFSQSGTRHDSQIPNPLDVVNVPTRKEVQLSAEWTGRTN